MGFEVDPKLVNKLKSQMREKILANPEIPDEIKFSGTLDFDIPAKVELSDKQMAVAVKLLKGYYNNKPVDLQKDLNSIDRKLAWTILQGGDFSGMDFHGVDFSVSNLSRTKFKNCDLSNCKFVFSLLSDADFSGARLGGADCSMIVAVGRSE